MKLRVSRHLNWLLKESGWEEVESENEVVLQKENEKIAIRLFKKRLSTEIIGGGQIIFKRGEAISRLTSGVEGELKSGERIWLLSSGAVEEFARGKRDNFEEAALVAESCHKEEGRGEIYVREKRFFDERKSKSLNLLLAAGILSLLILGTIFGYRKKTELETAKKYQEIRQKVEVKIEKIESVRSMDMEAALTLAKEAEGLLDESSQLADLKQKIDELKKGLGAENIDFPVAYDSTLILEGENQFEGMASRENIVYLWSKEKGEINAIDFNVGAKDKIMADEAIKNWREIFNGGEKWFGFDDKSIYEIKRSGIEKNREIGIENPKYLYSWGSLIYGVDEVKSKIVKIAQNGNTDWLNADTKLEEKVEGMTIDGNIWILGESGKIYLYSRGKREDFKMSFVFSGTKVRKLESSDKVNFLAYIVDDKNVVVYEKNGKILGKYNFGNKKINDIAIDNLKKAVLVLAQDGKIYRIEIK